MKNIVTIFIVTIYWCNIYASDSSPKTFYEQQIHEGNPPSCVTIVLKNGTQIQGIIIDEAKTFIRYKPCDGTNVRKLLALSEVERVQYPDGTTKTYPEVLQNANVNNNSSVGNTIDSTSANIINDYNKANATDTSTSVVIADSQIVKQAITDAQAQYKPVELTLVIGLITFWGFIITGALLALLIDSSSMDARYYVKNKQLFNNQLYMNAYEEQAKKIRRKYLYNGVKAGLLALALLVLLFLFIVFLLIL